MLKQFLRTLLITVPQNAVCQEENSNPKVQEIKPKLFLSALAAAVPRFHFPSLLSCFHCSCCFSCCSFSLSSCQSLPAVRVRVPIPLGRGAAHSCFACTAERKRPLHFSSPVIPLSFWYFTVSPSLLLNFSISQLWGEIECQLQHDIYLLDFCHAEDSTDQQGYPEGFQLPRAEARCVQREKNRTEADNL